MTSLASAGPSSASAIDAASPNRLVELIDTLARFEGPPEQFLARLLEGQCRIADASAGAILRFDNDGEVEIVSVTPDSSDADRPPSLAATQNNQPNWLRQAVRQTPRIFKQGLTLVSALRRTDAIYEDAPDRYLVMLPLLGTSHIRTASERGSSIRTASARTASVRGAAAFLLEGKSLAEVNECSQRLELSASLLHLYEMRLTLQRRQTDLLRLGRSVEALDALAEHASLEAAALAFCNHVASAWNGERVSLGFQEGREVKLRAMSHTEKFSRKMRVVQTLERVMEECADQDLEVIHPPVKDATYVSRAAAELSRHYGAETVCSLPLRKQGRVLAVVTLERSNAEPLTLDDLESLRLACEICTPRLSDLYEHGRWFGARMITTARRAAAGMVGPRHTWVKLTSVLAILAAMFLIFVEGRYEVEAPFVVQAPGQRVVPAPFSGYLQQVHVEPGDDVVAGETVLATLDTAELQLELASAKAELARFEKEAYLAMRDGETVQTQLARARAREVAARVDLLTDKIQRARLVAPISGIVLEGDLHDQVGAPVETGEVLFQVAPLAQLRADLQIPESRIPDVEAGQFGRLAAASHPTEAMRFQVEQIHPVAEVVEGRNVFKARVRLLETERWLRPGMEGVAKVHVGERPYGYIWSRELVNWIRMRLWW